MENHHYYFDKGPLVFTFSIQCGSSAWAGPNQCHMSLFFFWPLFVRNKDETLDELSALGLRHVGYGIPIELFGPFAEVCVTVMRPLIQEFPNSCSSSKLMWCPKDNAHQFHGDKHGEVLLRRCGVSNEESNP